MKKQTIKEVRQRQLTEAAFDVLKSHGIQGTTLEKVAKEAGLTKGVVLHYFADKDALVEAVMRDTNTRLKNCITALLEHSETPWERLYAVIYGNFAPSLFQKEVCHAWVCLCAEVPHNRQYQRIQTVIHARMRSNLMSGLRHLVSASEVDRMCASLTSLSDGLWLRAALQAGPISASAALSEIEFAIDKLFGGGMVIERDRSRARDKIANVANILFARR